MNVQLRAVLAFFVAVVAYLTAAPCLGYGGEIRVLVTPHTGEARVRISNRSKVATTDLVVEVELGGRRVRGEPIAKLLPTEQADVAVPFTPPASPGSHPLITRVAYEVGGLRMSVVHVASFDQDQGRRLDLRPSIRAIRMHQRGSVTVRYDKRLSLRLVVPEEIGIARTTELEDGRRFWLDNPYPTHDLRYAVYAVVEDEGSDLRGLSYARMPLRGVVVDKERSRFPVWLIAALGLAGLIASWLAYRSRGAESPERVVFIRYAFSVFTVSLLFVLYRTLYVVPDWVFTHLEPRKGWGWRITEILAKWLYFEGGDYDLFSRHVADTLYLYMLTANYAVLRWLIKPQPETDKWWHLLRAAFSRRWSKPAKVALLTLGVKSFYVPLVCSWTINNVTHQQNLWTLLSWDWLRIHTFLVAALILIDVLVFTVGYLVELPQLDNTIRSVEPTLLGWVVCLMCYPPFNRFSFAPFDQPLPIAWKPAVGFWHFFALSLIAIMWAFYCWATLALGARASNLTNRGIVRHGPYAYVRHPAYASKCFLWLVGGLFMGERGLVMVSGLTLIYALRAWTEERHLSQDADYLEYKKQVPYRVIPWLV